MEFKTPGWLPDPMPRALSMARPMTSWAARSHLLGQVPGFPDVSLCKRVGAPHTAVIDNSRFHCLHKQGCMSQAVRYTCVFLDES